MDCFTKIAASLTNQRKKEITLCKTGVLFKLPLVHGCSGVIIRSSGLYSSSRYVADILSCSWLGKEVRGWAPYDVTLL